MYKFLYDLSGSTVTCIALFAGGCLFGRPRSKQPAWKMSDWYMLRKPIGFDHVSIRPAWHSLIELMSRYQKHVVTRYCLAAVLRN